MMNYIETNKVAWEEAFDNRKPNWGDDNYIRLKKGNFEFFDSDMKNELLNMDFHGKIGLILQLSGVSGSLRLELDRRIA